MTPPRAILYILALGSGLLGFSLGAKTALAHAIVVAATPSAHQTVAQSELDVEIRFNSRVDVSSLAFDLGAARRRQRHFAAAWKRRVRNPDGKGPGTGKWALSSVMANA